MNVYRPTIDLMNLDRSPDTVEGVLAENPNTPNPHVLADLNRRSNESADRIEMLMLDIVTTPNHKAIEYKDIMHWRERARYLRRMGQAKEANELERAEAKALKDAKDADSDEEFMTGFKEFMANEFE